MKLEKTLYIFHPGAPDGEPWADFGLVNKMFKVDEWRAQFEIPKELLGQAHDPQAMCGWGTTVIQQQLKDFIYADKLREAQDMISLGMADFIGKMFYDRLGVKLMLKKERVDQLRKLRLRKRRRQRCRKGYR